jgi:putative addiction module component (TIGR02574 family)
MVVLFCRAVTWYSVVVVSQTPEDPFMSVTLEQFGIDRLDPQERWELIELIWDSLSADAPFTPPDWHLRELERRVVAADGEPGLAEPWETVLARLSKNHELASCSAS